MSTILNASKHIMRTNFQLSVPVVIVKVKIILFSVFSVLYYSIFFYLSYSSILNRGPANVKVPRTHLFI